MTTLSGRSFRRIEIKIVDKRQGVKPVLVEDCENGEVVLVRNCTDSYYLVGTLKGTRYGFNLDGTCWVGSDARVTHKVCAEVHVTGVEPI